MKIIEVNTSSKKYKVVVAEDYGGLGAALASEGLRGSLALVVADENTALFYFEKVSAVLSGFFGKISVCVLPSGEKNKDFRNVSRIYESLYAETADRKTTMFALGGGVVGDMAGFAAATYLRGLDYVQLPTTTLSQCDSSVGGKTGYNFAGTKNMIGAFHQPSLVYAATNTLATLDARQYSNGLAEAVKCAVALDADFFGYILENREKIAAREEETITEVIRRSCAIKAALVSEDEYDTGARALLNFGHTAGHAVEAASDFRLLHGEALSIGMLAELRLSLGRGNDIEKLVSDVSEILGRFGLPLKADGLPRDRLAKFLLSDKKTVNRELRAVIVRAPGKSFVDICSENEIIESLNAM